MTETSSRSHSREHIQRKGNGYWEDLVSGATARFKTRQLARLLHGREAPPGSALVDVGCGTSDLSRFIADGVRAAGIVCVDYDASIVERRRGAEQDRRVVWRVADARELGGFRESIGVVCFLDVLHEVYSFGGRDGDDLAIDHEVGLDAVRAVLGAAAAALEPAGMIVVTDDVLPPDPATIVVRCRSGAVADVVRRVANEYPSRRLRLDWHDDSTIALHAHELAILLTQYNKVKRGDLGRWRVEQLEVHQYMSVADYRHELAAIGLTAEIDIGTPPEALAEWREDFEVLSGSDDFPDKRIAVVGVKDA